jgi:lipoate-protein ligase A
MRARLVLSGFQSPAWNLALDEAMLSLAAPGTLVLRLYGFRPGAMILGARDAFASVDGAIRERRPVVRRAGAGPAALVREEDLGFSLALAQGRRRSAAPDLRSLAAAAVLGAAAALAPTEAGAGPERIFLLFPRRRGAVEQWSGVVFLGAARENGGPAGLLQPLAERDVAPDDLEDFRDAAMAALRSSFEARIGRALTDPGPPPSFAEAPPTPEELRLANRLCVERFAAPAWTHRR